jgi:hypothetical protein
VTEWAKNGWGYSGRPHSSSPWFKYLKKNFFSNAVFLNGNGKQEMCKNPAMPGTPYYFFYNVI